MTKAMFFLLEFAILFSFFKQIEWQSIQYCQDISLKTHKSQPHGGEEKRRKSQNQVIRTYIVW